MSKGEFDDITYYGLDHERNQYEAYPITNLGKMTSSLKNGSFIFILPSFYEEGLKKERKEFKYYHDNLYLGFTALDNVTNYECSREYHSGWWYPHALKYDWHSRSVKESCTHHPLNGTNLNGVFDRLNPNQTTRTIVFCQKEELNQCVVPKHINDDPSRDVIGWKYNHIETLKLKSTKMWLGHKGRKLP